MAEIPDVLPGELIESAWGNQIRDRALMRYINATERDTLNPTPNPGDLAYLDDVDRVQFFDGTAWVDVIDTRGGIFSGAVTIENDLDLIFLDPTNAFAKGALDVTAGGNFRIRFDPSADGSAGLLNRLLISDASETLDLRDSGGQTRLTVRETNVELSGVPLLTQAGDLANLAIQLGGTAIGFFRDPGDIIRFVSQSSVIVSVGANEYAGVDNSSQTVRNILVGTGIPNDAWGKDGDIYFRYDPTA